MTANELRAAILEEIDRVAPGAPTGTLGDTDDLREALDIDSMDMLNLTIALSRRLSIDIPERDVGRLATLAGAVAYLQARLKG